MRSGRSTALVLASLTIAAGCGGGEGDAGEAASAGVSIVSPEDGATVESSFRVRMAAEGMRIEPAGAVSDGAGHFHLMVDAACLPPGEEIPADEAHIHLDDAASETELSLPAGEHSLCLQAGDGRHTALAFTHEITVDVAGGGGGETTTEGTGRRVALWTGSYEGDVVWDCGPVGRRRGTLDAEHVVIGVDRDGRATLEANHTVTGSCAGATSGSRSTFISVTGRKADAGFRFPATTWQRPGSLVLTVTGDRARGRLIGPVPGPASITLDFELTCDSEIWSC